MVERMETRADGKRIDAATGVETVGHEWDGIEELNNPLPRWWVWCFYITIVWAIAYTLAYPAWPLLERGTSGLLGWTSRGELASETSSQNAIRAKVVAGLAAMPIDAIAANPELQAAALAGGAAAFKVNCVQCHGSGAAGSAGYPNLSDDDWLWGGNLAEIEYTLLNGVRHPGDAETRTSQMPAFGRDKLLGGDQINAVVSHVLSLSGKGAASAVGAQVFADNCAVCHGADGKGNRSLGAPNLADAVWLNGGSRAKVLASVSNAPTGVMPAWGERLDPVTIRMLAVYVHSLGGGEDFAPVVAQPTATPEAVADNGQP